MSVSTVYEDPTRSPKWCVRVTSSTHVATHRFYDRGLAEDFQERAYAPPDLVDAKLREANDALESGDAHRCVLALAGLSAAVEAQQFVEGRA
jgi:hypothetical protein